MSERVAAPLDFTCQMEMKETCEIKEATGFQLAAVFLFAKIKCKVFQFTHCQCLNNPLKLTTQVFQIMCSYHTHPSALQMSGFGLFGL